jgi:hypothetical protein
LNNSILGDHGSQITELYAYQSSQKVSLNQNSRIKILVADHGSQIAARILRLANSEKKFKKSILGDHGSQITELYAYQPSQKVSLNQNSRIQILVADHGSQIAARILKAGKF